jgi:hypothetical protein
MVNAYALEMVDKVLSAETNRRIEESEKETIAAVSTVCFNQW